VEDSAFSDEFCRFIQTTVPSVGAAEVLLNLLRQPGRPWSAAEATREQPRDAIVSEDDARKWLELFAARGVVAQTPDGRFRYGPASADVDALVRILERAYNERPVTLIQMIYALRDAKIRSFADAFKFRKS
jgi:hypothetical protein